jgi:hypothetical protein
MTTTFSPSEAALSIFELTKRQPQFVLRFCIIYAVVMILTFALAGATGVGQALANYIALAAGGKVPTPEDLMEVLAPATTGITILLIFGFIAGVLTSAMGLRKAVRDEDVGLFGLQFGGDEVRLFAAMMLVGAILFAVNIVISIIGALVTLGNASLLALTVSAALYGMIFVGVRLSQFGVLTIANRSIAVVTSWKETKGHFWRFIGAYVLWSVIAFVLSMVVQALATFGASLMGSKVGGGMPATLAEFLTPGWLFYGLIYGLIAGFGNLGSICIGAYAWHQMRGNLPVAANTAF